MSKRDSEVEAALAAVPGLSNPELVQSAREVFADHRKAPARFAKKLKKLTDGVPTEQAGVGRELLELGASLLATRHPDKAARLFSLARRLERSSKLAVDAPALLARATAMARTGALDRRDAGRLLKATTKDVGALIKSHPAAVSARVAAALELVEALLAGGGLPPDALLTDVEKLLKRAKLPAAQRTARLQQCVEALLRAPALPDASAKFWAAHAGPISAAVRDRPELQDAVIRATPQIQPLGYGGSFDRGLADTWDELLGASGCLDALCAGALATSAADFVELACRRVGVVSASDLLCKWLEHLAEPLAAGRPLRLFLDDNGTQSFDADVLDLAIALELPLEDPAALSRPWLSLGAWRERHDCGAATRALTGLADHPGFGALFASAFAHFVRDSFHGDAFATASLTVEGFRPLWRRRLARAAAALTEGTVLSLDHTVATLGPLMGPELLRAVPELADVVERIDVAALLGRTLREGLVDEWGWPAHDQALRRIPSAGPFDSDGFTPLKTVYTADRFVVCGPDGIVHDGPLELPEGVDEPRRVLWIGGEALVVYHHGSLLLARWGAGADGPTWQTDYLHMGLTGWVLPDGAVTAGGAAIRPGDRTWDPEGGLLTDGKGTWRLRGERPGRRLEAFDPETGEATDAPLHPWLAEVDPDAVELLRLLPSWGEHPNPVGAPGAAWGLRASVDGEVAVAERLDGRTWRGALPRGRHGPSELRALMTFPAGEGLHAVHADDDRNCTLVRTADGAHPLAPVLYPGVYSAGSPQLLGPACWGLLRPRDEPGSRSLRRATDTAAAAVLRAAQQQGAASLPRFRPFDTDEGPEGEPAVFRRLPGMLGAVRDAFPEVTHPSLRAGIAGVAVRAAQLEAAVAEWRGSLAVLLDAEPLAPEDDIADGEAPILRTLLPRGAAFFGTFHLGRQLRATEAFFLDAEVEDGAVRPVPRSAIGWDALLHDAAPLAWRAAMHGAVDGDQRAGMRRVLSLWARCGLARGDVRARLRRTFGRSETYPVQGMTWRDAERLAAVDGRRYLARLVDASSAKVRGFGVLELRPEGAGFADLLPAEWARGAGRWGTASEVSALLEALDERGPVPADAAVAEHIAARTGLMQASALLLWTGALRARLPLHEGAREALGLTHDDLKLVSLELDVDLDALYRAAMPADPAALWSPLEPDGSGSSVVDRLVEAWGELVGARPPLDRDVLLRVFDDLGDDHRHDVRLRQILRADDVAAFTRDAAWVVRPYTGFRNNISYMRGYVPTGWPRTVDQPLDEDGVPGDVFSGATLRTMARYLPWLYQELPLGSALHAAAARWAEALDRRLCNPELMLLAGAVDLSGIEDPDRLAAAFAELRQHFDGAPYASPDGGPVAPGVDRGDLVVTWPEDLPNGVFAAFRPAALADAEALRRLSRELGFSDAFERQGGACTCGLRFGQWDALDLTELDEFLAWRSGGLRRIRTRLLEGSGGYDADPRVSAPTVVEEAQGALDLPEPAAVLYLQTLALARPSEAHVRRYTGWSRAEYTEAAAVLVERGLVVERKVPATGRRWFLDEPIADFPTRSSPLERSKLGLYGIEPDRRGRLLPPFGMVLPLRPLGELFAEAWG